nr:stress response protein ish1 [Quercus suber]
MRFSFASAAVLALATQSVVGDSWFGKAAYNKWHETELERWLSDNNVPYPTPADRKDLENLVKSNWDNNVVKPYNSWDVNQLSNYLSSQGHQIKKGTEKNKDSLISQAQTYWKETSDSANDAYANVQNWIFDSWTESQLKAFLDYHNIPNPSPRTRDSLLHTARSNYQAAANKIGETAAYPGDWLYKSWSDSDLKAWLDERGIPVPQPGKRDKLIASIRRNSKIASDHAAAQYSSLSASAAGAQQSLSDALLESWSDSQIKEWCDKNGVKVPQGSKRNELVALARKHAAALTGNNVASSASSAFGAATTSAGNIYAQQTKGLYNQARYYYDLALNQLGLASAQASSSISSASSVASSKASVLSKTASASASSASKQASKAGQNAASAASSAAQDVYNSAKSELHDSDEKFNLRFPGRRGQSAL